MPTVVKLLNFPGQCNLFQIEFHNDFGISVILTRVAKRGIAPAESPLFLAPWGRGSGRGQFLKEHRGITGAGNTYALGDFWGLFPKG